MYKQEISKIKNHIQKGRWRLDEAVNADDFKKVKDNLDFANYEIESASIGIMELCRKADAESVKNELGEMFSNSASGSIELVENSWLYMRLETLLPNTRNNVGIKTITNTINNLLDAYSDYRGELPQYEYVFLAIIEHRNPDCSGSYDHDNKGFRAVKSRLLTNCSKTYPTDTRHCRHTGFSSRRTRKYSGIS